jgi:hypothetical protein
MEQTIKLEMTKDEATQLSAVMEQFIKVLDEANAHSEQVHAEIDRLQAENGAMLNQLEAMLNVETVSGYFR